MSIGLEFAGIRVNIQNEPKPNKVECRGILMRSPALERRRTLAPGSESQY